MDLNDVGFEVERAHQSNQCTTHVVSVYTVLDQPGIEMERSAVQCSADRWRQTEVRPTPNVPVSDFRHERRDRGSCNKMHEMYELRSTQITIAPSI